MYVFFVASTTIIDRCPEGRSIIDLGPGSYPTRSFLITKTRARDDHWLEVFSFAMPYLVTLSSL